MCPNKKYKSQSGRSNWLWLSNIKCDGGIYIYVHVYLKKDTSIFLLINLRKLKIFLKFYSFRGQILMRQILSNSEIIS